MPEKLIRPAGNYRKLLSYQKTEVIYEMTFYFCQKYLQKGDRTIDQMVQAARSGKQNIIEGCAASATSAKTEIKLVKCGEGESARVARRLYRLSAHSQASAMGRRLCGVDGYA